MRIEEQIRSALRKRAASVVDNEDALWDSITRRLEGTRPPRPEQLRHRLLVATVALIIGLTPVVLVARAFLADDSSVAGRPAFDMAAYGTYRFRDVAVGPVGDHFQGPTSKNTVEVTAVSEWTQEQYPGEHECRYTVYDAMGQEIGSELITFSTMVSGGRQSFSLDVDHPDRAATASVACDPERLDTPVAYDIANERVTGTFAWRDHVSGVSVAFDVSWPVQLPDYPSMNACETVLSRPSGEVVAMASFNLGTGPGHHTQRVWRDEFANPPALEEADKLIANVECVPYTGTDANVGEDATDGESGALPESVVTPSAGSQDPNAIPKEHQLLSGQYRFVDVRIVSQDANSATVSYGISWETADYPGVRRCTWTAIGSDGSVVGSFSDKVVSLSPTVLGTNVKTEIPIRSQAQKVNVSCGERLDTGEPYEYEFSDIVVQEPLELSFRYRWLGPAAPGAVSCVAMVLAPDGTIKAQTRSNLFSLLRTGEGSFRFDRSQVSVGESEPSRLEGQIDCVPYE